MTYPPALTKLLTLDEYLEYEEAALGKREYVAGEVYAVPGVSARHNLLALNIVDRLRSAGNGESCQVFMSDVKLRAADDVIYYPDIMVFCGAFDPAAVVIRDPCLVVEITSPSTARFDRSEKLDVYRRIPSLKSYLIVEQAWRRVDRHWRDSKGEWQRAIVVEGAIPIPSPEIDLTLDDIYEGLEPLTAREMQAIGYSA